MLRTGFFAVLLTVSFSLLTSCGRTGQRGSLVNHNPINEAQYTLISPNEAGEVEKRALGQLVRESGTNYIGYIESADFSSKVRTATVSPKDRASLPEIQQLNLSVAPADTRALLATALNWNGEFSLDNSWLWDSVVFENTRSDTMSIVGFSAFPLVLRKADGSIMPRPAGVRLRGKL